MNMTSSKIEILYMKIVHSVIHLKAGNSRLDKAKGKTCIEELREESVHKDNEIE